MANEQKVIEITVKYDDALRGIISLQDSIKQLTEAQKANQRQTQSEKDAFAANTVQLKEYRSQLTALIKEVGNNAKAESKQLGYIQQLKVDVSQLTAQYERLTKAELESAKGGEVLKALQDKRAALSAANEAYGNFSLNVGNYSSATKQFNMNLTQVIRELPNFALSTRIGVMAISNNLPMLIESMKALRQENALLRAEGKPTTSMWKTLGQSIFGVVGIANIAVFALQLLTPTLEKWADSLFSAKKQSDEFSKSLKSQTEVMQDAMKDGGVYKQAIENIQKVTTAQRQYEKGIMSAKEFTQIYNETLGDTFGKAKSAGEAIKSIADKKDAYINAMKNMTYANALFAASASDMVKSVEIGLKSNSELVGKESARYTKLIKEASEDRLAILKGETVTTNVLSNGVWIKRAVTYEEALKKENDLRTHYNQLADKERSNQLTSITKHQQTLEKQAQIYADRAQSTAQKSNITLTKIEEEKQKKEKKQAEEKLMTMKDIADEQIKILESELDAYIAINQAKINDEETTQAEIFRIQKENAEKRKQIEQDILDERLLANEISFDEYYNLSQEVNAKYAKSIAKTDSDIAKHKKVVEAINLSNQIEAIKNNAIRETAERRKSLKEQEDDEISKAEKSGADQSLIRAKYAELNKEIDKDVENSKLESISSLAGAIGSFFGKNTIAAKAAGVAEASINGYLAVQKALASFPPPFNYIAAAAVGIQAAANVKNILAVDTSAATSAASAVSSSQSKPKTYHTGGDITNDGTANNSGEIGITALVGEKMMNRNAANMFSPILDQMNAAGIGRSSLSGLSFAPQFNYSLFAKATAAAVASLPAPEVSVKEISKVNTRVTTIKEIGSYSSKK